jgi:hypothetical protein
MDQSHQTSVQRDQQLFEDLVRPCTEIDAATAGRAADLSAPARVQQASRLQVGLSRVERSAAGLVLVGA